MKENKFYTAVGFFIAAGFLSLLFLAVRVSGVREFYKKEPTYTISAQFTNVGDLKPQSRVTIAGVTVGRVVSIELNKEDFLARVSINLLKKYSSIPKDSKLSIVTAGLLGDNYLSFTPGFSEENLEENSLIDTNQTLSAVILEELISKVLANFQNK